MWIHEAFATYAEIEVIEHRFGKEAAYNRYWIRSAQSNNAEPVIGVYDVNHIIMISVTCIAREVLCCIRSEMSWTIIRFG